MLFEKIKEEIAKVFHPLRSEVEALKARVDELESALKGEVESISADVAKVEAKAEGALVSAPKIDISVDKIPGTVVVNGELERPTAPPAVDPRTVIVHA